MGGRAVIGGSRREEVLISSGPGRLAPCATCDYTTDSGRMVLDPRPPHVGQIHQDKHWDPTLGHRDKDPWDGA